MTDDTGPFWSPEAEHAQWVLAVNSTGDTHGVGPCQRCGHMTFGIIRFGFSNSGPGIPYVAHEDESDCESPRLRPHPPEPPVYRPVTPDAVHPDLLPWFDEVER